MPLTDKTGVLARVAAGQTVRLELGCGHAKQDADAVGIDALDLPARVVLVRPYYVDPQTWRFPRLDLYSVPLVRAEVDGGAPDPNRLYDAVVGKVSPGRLDVAVGPWNATIDTSQVHWSSRAKDKRFDVGDVVRVRSRENAKAVPQGTASGSASTSPASPPSSPPPRSRRSCGRTRS